MKKMWPVFVVLLLMCVFLWVAGTAAIAQDQCDVVGNSYTVTLSGDEWTLTDFTNITGFSPAPRCGGNVSLVGPGDEWSHYKWCVRGNGLIIAGYPAVLTGNGINFYVVPLGLHSLRIGDTVYMTEEEVPSILFIE